MKLEHARRLQRATIDQQNARNELIGATTDEQTIASAAAFMAATDAVCAVTGLVELDVLNDASNCEASEGVWQSLSRPCAASTQGHHPT